MTSNYSEEFDVVVVGTGAAGLTAAVAAALRGLSVLVVEKTQYYGGTTAFSGGVVWVPANPFFKRLNLNWYLPGVGLADSVEKGRAYLQATVGDRVPADRRDAFVEAGPAMMTELTERAGLRWRHWPFPDYYSEAPGGISVGRSVEPDIFDGRKLGPELAQLRPPSPAFAIKGVVMTAKEGIGMSFGIAGPRGPVSAACVAGRWLRARLTPWKPLANGRALIAQLRLAMKRLDVPLWLNASLVELSTEDGGGQRPRVDGVRVRRDGQVVSVRARRGVILATGGFARSQELREKYLPQPTSAEWTLVPEEGQEGDVIELGLSVGAKLDLMDSAWGFPTVMLPNRAGDVVPYMALYERIKPGVIIVNSQGERYFDEGMPYEQSWHVMYEKYSPEAQTVPSWMIFDQRAQNRFTFFKAPPRLPFPRRWFRNGDMIKEPTLERLAERTGLPRERLLATVHRFNEMARNGKDEDFGKGETAFARFFGDPKSANPNLHPIEQGPFYATRVYPGDLSTKGGLLTDRHARVLREDDTVIEGLYAAGNCSASVMGDTYPGGGGTIAPAMVFGYVAAGHCAALEDRR